MLNGHEIIYVRSYSPTKKQGKRLHFLFVHHICNPQLVHLEILVCLVFELGHCAAHLVDQVAEAFSFVLVVLLLAILFGL